MDVLKLFLYVVGVIAHAVLWLVRSVLWFVLRFIFRRVGKAFTWKSRTESGHEVVTYDDGRRLIKLEGKKGAPTRYLPDTPQLRARLLAEKRRKSFWRFFRNA